MTTKRDVNNPWNNKPTSGNPVKSNKGSANAKPKNKPADQKFLEAREKHEEYAKKHNILDYDSSSDEELETGSMLGKCADHSLPFTINSTNFLQNPCSRIIPEIMQNCSVHRIFWKMFFNPVQRHA